MPKSRTEVLLTLARGLLCAIALTLAGSLESVVISVNVQG